MQNMECAQLYDSWTLLGINVIIYLSKKKKLLQKTVF